MCLKMKRRLSLLLTTEISSDDSDEENQILNLFLEKYTNFFRLLALQVPPEM